MFEYRRKKGRKKKGPDSNELRPFLALYLSNRVSGNCPLPGWDNYSNGVGGGVKVVTGFCVQRLTNTRWF
jgi:hypothetical protein